METILTSLVAFITTNIDDIFILMLLFGDPRLQRTNVVTGQFLGIGALILVSFLGSFIGLIIDLKYVGLLGLVPIYIGIKSAVSLFKQGAGEDNERSIQLSGENYGMAFPQVLTVAAITIANGGDNISIYIPLYATLATAGKITMTAIFFIMTGVWCFIARYLSNHPVVKKSIDRYGHMITPFVFILLGIYIIYESGTLGLFKS